MVATIYHLVDQRCHVINLNYLTVIKGIRIRFINQLIITINIPLAKA